MAINPEFLQRVVLAGEKLMYDKATFHIFQAGMMKQGPLPEILAKEAAGLIKILDERAKGQIPKNVILPAATMLLTEMADFMIKAKLANPTKDDIVAGIKLLVGLVMKVYGVDQPSAAGAPAGQVPQAAPVQPQVPPQAQPPQPQGLLGA